ncbi:acyltransferase family protein [Mucilaginibacter sp.]
MSINLEKAIQRENNNFDLIRLIAALAVIFGHSFNLFPTNGYQEPISILLKNDYSGSLAVYVFFFLSGIFITSSFNKSKSPVKFVIARAFRIWPALIVCILLTVFVIGPIFTNRSLVDYFTAHQTWRYLIKNILIFHFEAPLTGVFGNGVNGSLWTLHTEVLCYFIIFVIGVLGLLKRKIYVIIVLIIFYLIRHNQYFVSCFDQSANVMQLMFFLFGTLSYTFRKYFIIDYKIGLAIIGIFLISYVLNFSGTKWLSYVALIYSMLLLATAGFFKRLKPPGDFSYGIYIYGFLIQQIIVYLFPKLTSYPSMLITIPLACIVGSISWYLIEYPAIKKAKSFRLNMMLGNSK